MKPERDDTGTFPAYAWPGGYPLFYLMADGGTLCPKCQNDARETDEECPDDDQWRAVAVDVNWEDSDLYCDHCGDRIESAYAEEN